MRATASRVSLVVVLLMGGRAAVAEAPGFDAFFHAFRSAVVRQDAAAVASMTQLPFLYEGEALGREAVEGIVPTLFSPAVRACVGQASPVAEEAARVVFCAPYAFYFRAEPDGRWRFDTFGADGEDAP